MNFFFTFYKKRRTKHVDLCPFFINLWVIRSKKLIFYHILSPSNKWHECVTNGSRVHLMSCYSYISWFVTKWESGGSVLGLLQDTNLLYHFSSFRFANPFFFSRCELLLVLFAGLCEASPSSPFRRRDRRDRRDRRNRPRSDKKNAPSKIKQH